MVLRLGLGIPKTPYGDFPFYLTILSMNLKFYILNLFSVNCLPFSQEGTTLIAEFTALGK